MLLMEGDRRERDGDREGDEARQGDEAVLLTDGDRRDEEMVTEERRLCS